MVERFQPSSKISLVPLARQCARWAEDNLPALRNADPKIPSGLHDRAADNWTLMFSIADAAGGRWPETARRIALSLSGEEDSSTRVRLLADIRDIFEREGRDRLPSVAICDALARMEDRPWPEWKKTGRPITTAALARQLAHFKIKPEGIRIGDKTPKGYKINQFGDTFTRYLGDSPFQSATPQQINDSAAYSPNQSATLRVDVAVSNARKPAEKLECCGVALPKGGIGQEDNSSPEIDDIEREAIQDEGSGQLE